MWLLHWKVSLRLIKLSLTFLIFLSTIDFFILLEIDSSLPIFKFMIELLLEILRTILNSVNVGYHYALRVYTWLRPNVQVLIMCLLDFRPIPSEISGGHVSIRKCFLLAFGRLMTGGCNCLRCYQVYGWIIIEKVSFLDDFFQSMGKVPDRIAWDYDIIDFLHLLLWWDLCIGQHMLWIIHQSLSVYFDL